MVKYINFFQGYRVKLAIISEAIDFEIYLVSLVLSRVLLSPILLLSPYQMRGPVITVLVSSWYVRALLVNVPVTSYYSSCTSSQHIITIMYVHYFHVYYRQNITLTLYILKATVKKFKLAQAQG